ncbi:MAG: hypothetical protein J5I41_02795 [Saprospiraceae bacterium]|nr:hypothetical protein [Saprospiraceae bacterium]
MLHPLRWVAVACYAIALFLPAFQGSDLKGYHVLLFGVVGLVDFNLFFGLPWLANLFFLWSFIQRTGLIRTLVLAVGLLLATPAFLIREVPAEGSGALLPVAGDWGLWLWYASFVLLLVDALLGRRASLMPPRRNVNA